jgi:hypothetical protein
VLVGCLFSFITAEGCTGPPVTVAASGCSLLTASQARHLLGLNNAVQVAENGKGTCRYVGLGSDSGSYLAFRVYAGADAQVPPPGLSGPNPHYPPGNVDGVNTYWFPFHVEGRTRSGIPLTGGTESAEKDGLTISVTDVRSLVAEAAATGALEVLLPKL